MKRKSEVSVLPGSLNAEVADLSLAGRHAKFDDVRGPVGTAIGRVELDRRKGFLGSRQRSHAGRLRSYKFHVAGAHR